MAFSMSRTRFSSCRHVLQAAMLAAGLLLAPVSQAERIKDLASIQGVRDNPLIGYGLVVGLDGSGDQVRQAPSLSKA